MKTKYSDTFGLIIYVHARFEEKQIQVIMQQKLSVRTLVHDHCMCLFVILCNVAKKKET